MRYYKFVTWEAGDIEKIKQNPIPRAIESAENGDYKPLIHLYENNFSMDTLQNPIYKCLGWCFPFSHVLKTFWVKTKYYGIMECHAPNKTCIRKIIGTHNVYKIIEV